MKIVAIRVQQGKDLVQEIDRILLEYDIEAGVVLSGVGGLAKSKIRVPVIDGNLVYIYPKDLEIVSLNGTVSKHGCHLHISGSDIKGKVWGGHLKQGSIVRMTCELVIGIVPGTKFTREMDEQTGYKELRILEQ